MPGFDGSHLVQQLPYNALSAGLDLGGVFVTPPGGNLIYLRSTIPDNFDPPGINTRIATTLSEALKYCRASRGDRIIVLPGHSENVTDNTMLTNMVAGTQIIGVGWGSMMPTFRWTNTAGQWVLDDADVVIKGLRLRLEGANGITKAIVSTAADNCIFGCDVEVASGATAKAAIALEVGAGGHRFQLRGNIFRGTATHNVTDGVKVVAAVDAVAICDNEMVFSATAGNGNVHFTAAATNVKVGRNFFYNTHTASTACLVFDNVAVDGVAWDNRYATVNDGVATAQGATFGAGALIRCFENYSSDEPKKSGVLTPGAVAT